MVAYESVSDSYAVLRPDYPAAFVADLLRTLEIEAGSVAVDIGAGTGRLSMRLQALGCHVVAVEPLERMRRLVPSRVRLHTVGGTARAAAVAIGMC